MVEKLTAVQLAFFGPNFLFPVFETYNILTGARKMLRRIAGKTLMDGERSKHIRIAWKNIKILNRTHEWNEHLNRMDVCKISTERPRKRWNDNLNANEKEACNR